jgi:hypothetical protein
MSASVHRVLLKAKYSFYSSVVFFLFANPETVRILQHVLRGVVTIQSPSGGLTVEGIFLTTALFFLTMLGLMLLPSE